MDLTAPPGQLPASVLASIFRLLQDDMISATYPRWPFSSHWINVTWVCRYWRTVALNTPELWTAIDVDQDREASAVAALLERASEGIDFRCSTRVTNLGLILNIVAPHAHQLQSLVMEVFNDDQVRAIQNFVAANYFPDLTILSVTTQIGLQSALVVGQNAPSLLEIHMDGLAALTPEVGIQQDTFANMDNVVLRRCDYTDVDLTALLKACHQTSYLHLIHSSPAVHASDVTTLVEMPKMKTLVIEDVLEHIPNALSRIVLPESVRFKLNAQISSHSLLVETGLFLLNILPPQRATTLPSLAATLALSIYAPSRQAAEAEPDILLEGWADADNIAGTWNITASGCRGSITSPPGMFPFPTTVSALPAYVNTIFNELPQVVNISRITHLEIHLTPDADHLSSGDWVTLFGGLPYLQLLEVGGTVAICTAIDALSSGPAALMGPPLLPRLRALTLCLAVLSGRSFVNPGAFETFLRLRTGHGAILANMTLRVPQAENDEHGEYGNYNDMLPQTLELAEQLANVGRQYARVFAVRDTCAACHFDCGEGLGLGDGDGVGSDAATYATYDAHSYDGESGGWRGAAAQGGWAALRRNQMDVD